MVAASHSGVRLLARHKDVFDDYIIIFEHIKYAELFITSAELRAHIMLTWVHPSIAPWAQRP